MAEDLDAKIVTAEAMLRAGNYARAKELSQEVLKKQDDHLEAFEVLYEIRTIDAEFDRALALALWRLERLPNCPYANVSHLHALCLLKRKQEATKTFKLLQTRLGNHPFELQRAELLYAYAFKRPKETRKLIAIARESGRFDSKWLDALESDMHADSGHIFTSRKMLSQALKESPMDADLLYDMSVTNVLTGHLPSAIKQAKRAKEINPPMAPAYNEVIIVATMGLIPLFWGAMSFLVLNASFVTRLPYLVRIPFNYLFMAIGIIIAMAIPLTMDALNINVPALNALILFGNIGFTLYLLFGFQHVGLRRAKKKNNISLNRDY
ncbi:hypothetical protein DES40_0989 [Litorimonas taeanensis]|uniref:Tetratricopeptide repeat protein n=1 Tax=Litorimonas taeanensis TaxID=568099 RepID=A0A420WL74_9PROT|nr:hypothetical protein [Litorimonas taeanensis]RKQ71662.1 hypothetical protein DES40_0989 [Litorimonas taeanensis]